MSIQRSFLMFPRFHGDDRRLGWFDVFGGYSEQVQDVNIVKIPRAGTLVAWHKHHHQTDLWFVLQGGLQAGVYNPSLRDTTWHFLTPEYGTVLVIPPGLYHGYKSLVDNTILVYGLTNKWDGSDEYRCSIEDIGVDWDLKVR